MDFDCVSKQFKHVFSNVSEMPEIFRNNHLPSLDGLRGVSIFLVVASHLVLYTNNYILAIIFNGALGVQVFFVISGFLITTLLLKEQYQNNRIALKRFYIRRILRIFPVAYLFIVTLIILNLVFKLHIPHLAIIGAALYVMNFPYFHGCWYTEHFWSLSIEEQFYLLFPFILKKSARVYLLVMFSLAVLVPLIILVQYMLNFNSFIIDKCLKYLFKFNGIAVGSVISFLLFYNIIRVNKLVKHKIYLNLILIPAIFALHVNPNYSVHSSLVNSSVAIFIAIIIISNLTYSEGFTYKFLNSKLLIHLGILSYSIYVWQQLFTRNMPWSGKFIFSDSVLLNILLLIGVSYISYHFYEKKFLKLKDKFQNYKSFSLKKRQNKLPLSSVQSQNEFPK